MRITLTTTPSDVDKVAALLRKMQHHKFVQRRERRNIRRQGLLFGHRIIWKTIIGCQLSSNQKSGEGTPTYRFMRSGSTLFSLRSCRSSRDLKKQALKELTEFGGIRFPKKISSQIADNFALLETGNWDTIDTILTPLKAGPASPQQERNAVQKLQGLLKGIGPKQSRNLLQGLGLTRYEIPLDSRIMNWLKANLFSPGFSDLLTATGLSKEPYYCSILDAIQSLCAEANVYPCILDASVFASFENK